MRKFSQNERKDRGSLTVEAILFLIPFMCAFLTLINVARYVQSEMLIHHAITQTAKQISTYSYILTKTEITATMQNTNKKSGEFISDTKKAVDSVTDFIGAVGEMGSSGDLSTGIDNVITKANTADETLTEYFSDPKEIMYGALAVVKSEGRKEVMTWAVGGITRGCIKETVSKVSDDPDKYLKNIGIVDGMAGLDFSKSKWVTNEGGKADIEIVVTYSLKNLLFPDFDFGEHEFCQCASTLIW